MKRTALKRRKRPRRRSKARDLIEDLDTLVRMIVMIRDNFRCRRCGKYRLHGRASIQASHIYPKGQWPNLRHEVGNVIALCSGCHLFWWHRNPIEAAAWVEEQFGEKHLAHLRFLAQTRTKVDKQALKIALERQLHALQAQALR